MYPLATDKLTVNTASTVVVGAPSVTVTSSIEIVGGASSSVIVAVWTVIAPGVAFVGVPMVTTTVSSGSSETSLFTAIVMSALSSPAVITIGVSVIV